MRWAAALVIASILVAPAASSGAARDGLEGALSELHAMDGRVAAMAFRLQVANREVCDDVAPQFGLTLHSALQYGPRLRPLAVRAFGLGDRVSVAVVVPGSPAEVAGLRSGDEILAIGATALPAVQASAGAPARYDQVATALSALREAGTDVAMTIRRDGEEQGVRLRGAAGCAYDIQLMPSETRNASADGNHVFITTAFVRYLARDEDLALVLGHEYAHDVLHHRAQLDRSGVMRRILGNFGSSPAALNRAEREADHVGLYLTARAGYDVSGAQAFWRRLREELGDPWYARWSHPGAREREARAAVTATEIAGRRARGEPLVWDRPGGHGR